MINFNEITNAIKSILEGNLAVREFTNGRNIVQGEVINYDPNQTPWIGIYRGSVNYEPRTLGSDNNWEGFPSVKIIVQATDIKSASRCEAALEGYVKIVIDAMLEDTTLKGTVDIITSFDVEQGYIETDRNTTYFQGASITFNMEVATQ